MSAHQATEVADVTDQQSDDERREHEQRFIEAQEHKGYGDDEGEREPILESEEEDAESGDG